jgi:type II secretory pathway component PulF
MSVSRLIVGLFFIFLGVVLAVVSFLEEWWLLIYAFVVLILGIVLLLNKKEDVIEGRKDIKIRKDKK